MLVQYKVGIIIYSSKHLLLVIIWLKFAHMALKDNHSLTQHQIYTNLLFGGPITNICTILMF